MLRLLDNAVWRQADTEKNLHNNVFRNPAHIVYVAFTRLWQWIWNHEVGWREKTQQVSRHVSAESARWEKKHH